MHRMPGGGRLPILSRGEFDENHDVARTLTILRIICGALVFASGLMGLGILGWEPPIAGPEARPFQIAMHNAGYFVPIMTAVFLVSGLSFILDRYVALAAIMLFPVSLNILLFHTVLEAGQIPVAVLFFAINCFMLWYRREAYAALLKSRIQNLP